MDSLIRFWVYIGIVLFVVLGINEVRPRAVFDPKGIVLPLVSETFPPVPAAQVSVGNVAGEPIGTIHVTSHDTLDLKGVVAEMQALAGKAGGNSISFQVENITSGVPALSEIFLKGTVYRDNF